MKVYIAGPMDGKPSYNFPAFNEAKRLWEGAGHSVTTPFDTNSRVWKQVTGTDFVPGITRCDYGDPILKQMFAEDLKVVCAVDAVVVLPGWQQSKGTRTEMIVALLMGVPILCHDPKFSHDPMQFVDLRDILDAVKSIDFTSPVPAPLPETILQEAQRVVHGDRGSSYGPPGDDYRCTGRIWGAMIDRWLHDIGLNLVPALSADEAVGDDTVRFPDIPTELGTLMMIAVKLSRQTHQHKRDNLTDIAGYAECVSMIQEAMAADRQPRLTLFDDTTAGFTMPDNVSGELFILNNDGSKTFVGVVNGAMHVTITKAKGRG